MRNLKEIKFPAHYLNSFRLYLKTDPFSSSKTSFDENQCGSENCRRTGRRLADGKKRGCCTPRLPPSLCLCRMQGAPRRDGRLRSPPRAQCLTLSGMGGSGPLPGLSVSPWCSVSPQPRLWPVQLAPDSRIRRGRAGPEEPPPVPDPLPQPPHGPAGAAGPHWAAGHPPAQPCCQPCHPQARQTGWWTSTAFLALVHDFPSLWIWSPDPHCFPSFQAFGLLSPLCSGMGEWEHQKGDKPSSRGGKVESLKWFIEQGEGILARADNGRRKGRVLN